MYGILIDSIEMLCRTVKKIVQKNRPSWVTVELTDAISEKNRLYKIAREKYDSDAWDMFHN